jgi:hypothetical protein
MTYVATRSHVCENLAAIVLVQFMVRELHVQRQQLSLPEEDRAPSHVSAGHME